MFNLLPLHFDFADLAPAMTEPTARWHHEVEHRRYLDEVNRLIQPHSEPSNLTIEELLAKPSRLPKDIRDEFRYWGGGHANHQFMWKILGRARGLKPSGALAAAIDTHFGDFAGFTNTFKTAALAAEGEGWIFLSLSAPRTPAIEILYLEENGNVLEIGKPGVLICDLWQHAYARDHGGDRSAWIDAYLQIVDWSVCSMRYEHFIKGEPAP